MLSNHPFLKWSLVSFLLSIIFFCSSCLALFDSSNFGDVNKLKRVMLDATWQVEEMHVEEAERANRDEPYTITLDSVVAASGSMYFAEDSERGRRDLTYTNTNGDVIEGAFIIEADVEDDNPTIQFDIKPELFPHPYRVSNKFKVLSFNENRIELFYSLDGTGDRTRYQYTIDLVK